MTLQIVVDQARIEEFCKRNHIAKLAFFGSVTGNDFRGDSDVDVLVEYDSAHVPDFFEFADQQDALAGILGRKVDLHTPASLNKRFREEVLHHAIVQYAA